MRLEPASRWSYAELAEIFNAGYEGYYTPFTLDEAAFRFMSTTWDDDLDASRVALVDGGPAGICKLDDPWQRADETVANLDHVEGPRVSAALSSSAAPASGSRSCRASPPTTPLPASSSRASRPRPRRFSG